MASHDPIEAHVKALMALAPAGFAMAFHVRYTRPAFLIQSYPTDWIEIYSARGYVMTDPTVRWGFENEGSVRWSELAGQDAEGVFAEAAQHGLTYGLSHAIDAGHSRSMASFARGDREFDDTEIAEIADRMDAIHNATDATLALGGKTATAIRRLPVHLTQA